MAYASLQVPDENKTPTQEVDRLQKIKEKGILTVLSSNRKPYSYQDPKTGEFTGSDAEIIREVANRLGVKEVRVRYFPFPNILEELVRNPNIDLIAEGLIITEERKQFVNFTDVIYIVNDAILTRNDSGINNKEDLKNATIGILGGSVLMPIAERWKKEGLIKDYTTLYTSESLQNALERKVVNAILTNSTIAEYIILANPKSNFKVLLPTQYKPEETFKVAYPLKKEDDTLLNEINEKLQEMRADGTMYNILIKYGLKSYYIL